MKEYYGFYKYEWFIIGVIIFIMVFKTIQMYCF